MERHRFRWARAAAHVPDVPVEEPLVVDARRAVSTSALDEIFPFSPLFGDLPEISFPFIHGGRPRVVRCPEPACRGVIEDQRVHTFRVGGGEEHSQSGPFVRRPQRGLLTPECVQDGAHVLHAILERRQLVDGIGQAAAPLVEEDHAGK